MSSFHPPSAVDDLRDFLDFAQVLVVALDADGRVEFVNREACSVLGYDEDELVGRDWFETCIPETEREEVRAAFDRLMAGAVDADSVDTHENATLTKDGYERIVEWRNTPTYDDEGRITGTLSSGRDVTRRKAQTRELERNRRRYRALVEQFPNGLVTLFDEDHRYQIVGGDGFDRVAFSPSDLEGERLQDAFPPENVRKMEPLYRRALAGESSVTELTLDGHTFRIHVVPVYDGGEVVAGMTMSQDVTEQRATERELRERELLLSQAQEIADIGSWSLDVETESLRWSAECRRIFGLDGEGDLTYGDFVDHVHPDDREMVDENWARALEGESYDIEHRIVVDGETRWLRERAVIECDEDGAPEEAIGVVQDITDRKEREQELEATTRRYQTLLEAAPDPVFVADAETGEIVETNEAGEDLLGRPREEIVGRHQSTLHPADERERYRDLFERHVEAGGRMRRLPDGSPILVASADGEVIPVEIDVTTLELGDDAVVYGIFRDVSEQRAYERALAGLNNAAQRLFAARTTDAIDERISGTVTNVLSLPLVAVYRFDDTAGTLRPVECRTPDGIEGLPAELAAADPDDGVLWEAFVTGETRVDNDVGPGESPLRGETPIRSQLVVPIENYGIVAVGDTVPDQFDGRTVDLVEILVATAESAIERTEREQELQQREHELERRTRELERTDAINTQIRSVARAIVDAETRVEVAEAVCSHLVEADPITFAWVGSVDPIDETIDPKARAGDNERYLEEFDWSLSDAKTAEPAIRAVQSHERVVVSNTARDVTGAPWRRTALECGFQSVISVPLLYRESLQGVLSVYATTAAAFDERLHEVLSELGDLVAHAVVAIDRKQALVSNQMVELTFDINDQSCFFLRFPQDVGCRLALEGLIPKSDGTTLVFARVQGTDPEAVLDRAERAPEIRTVRLIEHDDDGALVQARFDEQFIGSYLADHGIRLRDVSADDEACRVTISLPPSYDVRRAVDVVRSRYVDSMLRSKRDRVPDDPQTFSRDVLDRLTPRQQEVLELAYHSGYFDSPKGSTGSELADNLDISSSAFHSHVRTAERKLLEAAFDRGDGA